MDKKLIGVIVGILIIGLLIGSYFMFFYSPYKFREDRPIKIFILNSYHPDFPIGLVNEMKKGFYDSLEDRNFGDYEIKEFSMDINRLFSEELRLQTVIEAKDLIDEWEPDLILATNDDAQAYVIAPYYINSDIPVVFVGVSNNPEDYGFENAKNIAGILSVPLFSEAINFLKQLFPNVKKIAVVSEDNPRWSSTLDRLYREQGQMPDIEFIGWHRFSSYREFQEAILDYQDEVDAFLFTPMDTLKDDSGKNVLFLDVVKWITENSYLPEISFWQVPKEGLFVAVTPFSYVQGRAAGGLVDEILIGGKKPKSFEFKQLKAGCNYINLARAKSLGLERNEIPSTILINSEVIEKFPWEEGL